MDAEIRGELETLVAAVVELQKSTMRYEAQIALQGSIIQWLLHRGALGGLSQAAQEKWRNTLGRFRTIVMDSDDPSCLDDLIEAIETSFGVPPIF